MSSPDGSAFNTKLLEDIGEDPTVFLDRPIDYDAQIPFARIKGIDYLHVLRAWQAVERRLGRGENGGPRTHVMDALEKREAYLQEHGDRDERMAPRDYDRDLPPAMVTINGERVDERSKSASQRLYEMNQESVATDGGESDGE